MGKLLWKPSASTVQKANITRFIDFVNKTYNLKLKTYADLYTWSVEKIPDFWAAVWTFSGVKASQPFEKVIEDVNVFIGANWFPGARLNFAENLLRFKDDQVAFLFRGEGQKKTTMTYAQLHDQVARLAKSLRALGIIAGDRVGAYIPNLPETAIAMLAATSIGAIWSSCGAELGPTAVIDRLGQIEPKILFTADGYFYKGKVFPTLPNAEQVIKAIPSLKKVIVVSYTSDKPDISKIPNAVLYTEFLAKDKKPAIKFEQLPFNHPVYIMFSSGTTGKPKCMVQGAGGILINHLKELILQTDLRREDKIIYITAPSWMMWNWLVSSLAVGATVVLYDGNPNHPDWRNMWSLIQEEKVTIFGCSASYINFLMSQGAKPGKEFDLTSLREISQTASPLSSEGFEWLYAEVKKDFHFNSISGGTDINGCFAAGSPTLPVYAGELQAAALGMKVKAYDEKANPVFDQEGELVCEAPSPSMPLYFWNDKGNEKYANAYFNFYKPIGKNVWRHGDYVIIHKKTGGITFYGRSDAVLKPSGVRIGTAEIYNVVQSIPEIADSLAIGQPWKGDQRVILFVKMAPGKKFTDEIKTKIKKALLEKASPRHVPAVILETPDIPYTFNMKKVEISVQNIIEGRPVTNRDALVNAESLDFFEKIKPELQKDI
nr:acetoacetate--CoA ligase [Candidatus Sigynarchaeota archaeon]